MTPRLESLQTFVNFCREHIRGDEKGEAQSFLNEFFRAFGHDGALQAGAVFEERIKKGSKKGKTGFADLVWKPRVLIEMKKRGTDLGKHYSQAFDYWQRAVPNRPRYVVLCNFDEFWIYDFDVQIDTPVDTVTLEQLPQQSGAFAFMEKGDRKPVFRNNQVEVTEKAARRMGELLVMLQKRGVERLAAQHLVLQCVLAMFAEDRNLLPSNLFVSCIQDCLGGKSSYDVLSALFREMNQPGITPSGQFEGVDYFNGGLFATVQPLELTKEELKMLEVSALEDWSKVRPAIFGSIFESAIDQDERHAHGIHYTSEADIMKIVRPTISRYWEERIESSNTIPQLESLQLELQNYRVLDPACGSGNFLYIAYQELKQIEQLLLDKIASRRRSPREQMQMGFVTPNQFFGIDNNPFAVELARVTMMIARKVAIDRLGLFEPALPLDTLDQNIVCEDALFGEWPEANAIIGNPPFLGGKYLKRDLGEGYVDRIYERFPDVKGSVDFCVYWFRLTHQHLEQGQRAGLVGTKTVKENVSRTAGLSYILEDQGRVYEAISNQKWSGEANVHVSIVNWCKSSVEKYYLDDVEVSSINSSLTTEIDVTGAPKIEANKNFSFQGITPRGKRFVLSEYEATSVIESDQKNRDVMKRLLDAGALTETVDIQPKRWFIDFNNRTFEDASNYPQVLEYLKQFIKKNEKEIKDDWSADNWWLFWRNRSKMRECLKPLDYCFAVPRHSTWFTFLKVSTDWLPNDSTVVVASKDLYILGILSSTLHRSWIEAQCSRLKSDTRYTHTTCFETFPFPQSPGKDVADSIRSKAIELNQYRNEQMEQKGWGITDLYKNYFDESTSRLHKLHQELDALVLAAYSFNSESIEGLLSLNSELIAREKKGESVVGPWEPHI